jgi:hypothetical protein
VTGFTPGPWAAVKCHPGTSTWGVRGPDGKTYATTWSGANANLVASAPELYDAVSALLEQFVDPQQGIHQFDSGIVRKSVERAFSALAKARGEA